MNPLMAQMGMRGAADLSGLQQARQAMAAFKAMQDPKAALAQIAQQNPQIMAVLQMCQGRDPKDVFYDQCRQHGLDPDSIIQQLM